MLNNQIKNKMETQFKVNPNELRTIEDRVFDGFNKSIEFCKTNKILINDKEEYNYSIDKNEVKLLTDKLSINQRKKMRRILRKVEKNTTLKSMNIFFHYLGKKLGLPINLKTSASIKENEIIKIRGEYKDLLSKLIEKRKEYKELKKSYIGVYTT